MLAPAEFAQLVREPGFVGVVGRQFERFSPTCSRGIHLSGLGLSVRTDFEQGCALGRLRSSRLYLLHGCGWFLLV